MSGIAERTVRRNKVWISDHFSLHEFECHGDDCCGNTAKIDAALIEFLERLRETVGRPLVVNSGYRCEKHNRDIGGSPISQHMDGVCADIRCPDGITLDDFNATVLGLDARRVGMYVNLDFLHISVVDQYKEGVLCSRTWRTF